MEKVKKGRGLIRWRGSSQGRDRVSETRFPCCCTFSFQTEQLLVHFTHSSAQTMSGLLVAIEVLCGRTNLLLILSPRQDPFLGILLPFDSHPTKMQSLQVILLLFHLFCFLHQTSWLTELEIIFQAGPLRRSPIKIPA